jgi:hypothetical protein
MRSSAKIRLKEDDLKSEAEPIWCAIEQIKIATFMWTR